MLASQSVVKVRLPSLKLQRKRTFGGCCVPMVIRRYIEHTEGETRVQRIERCFRFQRLFGLLPRSPKSSVTSNFPLPWHTIPASNVIRPGVMFFSPLFTDLDPSPTSSTGAQASALQRRGLCGGPATMGEEGRHARLHRGRREPGEGVPAGEEAQGQGEEEGEGDVDAAAGWSVGAAEETATGPADVLPEVGVTDVVL